MTGREGWMDGRVKEPLDRTQMEDRPVFDPEELKSGDRPKG